MADSRISNNSTLRAIEAVRAKRAAQKPDGIAEPIAIQPITTTQVRAKLNVFPDDHSLKSLIDQALTALSRGVRWARGSIINLIV